MKILYLDCFSGISGDMILGSLVDAGLPAEALKSAVDSLGLGGVSLSFETVTAGGISGTRARVIAREGEPHRHLPDILELIDASHLDDSVKKDARRVFRRLAEAEAAVHGIAADKVHFHEVGALDAIADITGAAAGFRLLGIERIYSSKIPFGRGTVECAHGTLPVPVPAVARLTEGFPVRFTDIEGELTTPTGAAILTTLAHRVGARIDMIPDAVGYGFGTRTRKGVPNALRAVVGRSPGDEDPQPVLLVETNVDDVTGQSLGFLMERAFEAGALDVFFTAVQMKKSRPGVRVSVLCREESLEAVEKTIFEETGSLGIRVAKASRAVASRKEETVETSLGPVRVKRSLFPRGGERISVEYEDLARLAREKEIPLRRLRAKLEAEIEGRE